MTRKLLSLAAVLVVPALSQAAVVTYTNQADFLSNVGSYFLEDFASHTTSGEMGLTEDYGPVNGFSFQATAFNSTYTASQVWASIGSLSTYSPVHTLQLAGTGQPVTAFGATVAPVDVNENVLPTRNLSVVVWDGSAETTINVTGQGFVGFISDTPLQWMQVTPYGGTGTEFSSVDNVYTGAAVPEPSAAILSLSAFGILALRRATRRA